MTEEERIIEALNNETNLSPFEKNLVQTIKMADKDNIGKLKRAYPKLVNFLCKK